MISEDKNTESQAKKVQSDKEKQRKLSLFRHNKANSGQSFNDEWYLENKPPHY